MESSKVDGMSSGEAALRDALVDVLSGAGVEVVTDAQEGQRVLDEANGEARLQAMIGEQKVYHGSGADFEAFDHSHMGEGEGAQSYGWGTYVTEVKASDGGLLDKAASVSGIERVKDALKRFWKGVADWLGIHYTTAEEVADKVLSDLLHSVNPVSAMKPGRSRRTRWHSPHEIRRG